MPPRKKQKKQASEPLPQLQLAGQSIPPRFHPLVDQSLVNEPEEQNLHDFIDAGKRPPNEEGTGRWKLTPRRSSVRFVDLGVSKSASHVVPCLVRLLNVYFNEKLNFALSPSPISKSKNSYRQHKLPDVAGKSVEIWSILDELIPQVGASEYALLALSPWPLFEDYSEASDCTEVQEVLGRACGNRVAVVHYHPELPFFELCCTLLHELLHCCGFDHTTTVQCLMNPCPYEPCVSGQLFLSPHNLEKLGVFLNVEARDIPGFALEHYKRLLADWGEIFATESGDPTGEITRVREWLVKRIEFSTASQAVINLT